MSAATRRFSIGAAAAFLLAAIVPAGAQTGPAKGEPIYLGVSGPLTGPNAQYGAQWKQGFDLALDEINGAGGINGRPLAYIFEDTQSDPRQSVAMAQKFVNDPQHRGRARRLLQPGLDGGLADLPAGEARAVRLHQFAPRLHQGWRLSCGAIRSARPTSSRSAPTMPSSGSG